MRPGTRLLLSAALAASLAACNHRASDVSPDGGGTDTGTKLCGDHGGLLPRLSSSTVGIGTRPFDGPAIVERSVPTELVLAFGGAPGTAPLFHSKFWGLQPLPVLPVGAKVWLTKSLAGDPPFRAFGVPPPWSFAIRDAKDGHILVGAASKPGKEAPPPIPFDNVQTSCTDAYKDECVAGTVVYSTVDVHGDVPVTIADNETRTVPLGGVDYDVTMMARTITATSGGCADYFVMDGIGMEVRAKDPAPLVAALEVGPPIACGRGNDDIQSVRFGSLGFDLDRTYDGKAFYAKRDDLCLLFDVPNASANPAAEPRSINFCLPAGLFPEPQVGQEFWITVSADPLANNLYVAALRGPNRGPLLLGSVAATPPFDAQTFPRISDTLGLPVELREQCMYGDGKPLWEAALGTTPPAVVPTDTHSIVTIAGKSYDAWFSNSYGAAELSLIAR